MDWAVNYYSVHCPGGDLTVEIQRGEKATSAFALLPVNSIKFYFIVLHRYFFFFFMMIYYVLQPKSCDGHSLL